jgi:hypothetical protein
MERLVLNVAAAQSQNASFDPRFLLVMVVVLMVMALVAFGRMLRPFREVVVALSAGLLVVLLLVAACVLAVSAIAMSQ